MSDPNAEIQMKVELAKFLEWLAPNDEEEEYDNEYEEDYGCEAEIEISLENNISTEESSGSDSDKSPDRVAPKTCEQGKLADEKSAKPQVLLAQNGGQFVDSIES